LISPLLLRAQPIRPLAQNYVQVAKSPNPAKIPLYSPALIRLPSGRLVASYLQARVAGSGGREFQVMLTSDDGGRTWTRRGTSDVQQGRFFTAGRTLYYLGTGKGLPIQRSDDQGLTWSQPAWLTDQSKVWNQTAANVWHANGCVYLEMERMMKRMDAWGAAEKAVVLLRASEAGDLTQGAAWSFSNDLTFADLIPGDRENDPAIDFFGVPFYRQNYPHRAPLAPGRSFSPMGWAEGNVVQLMDPDNYWTDPTGKTFHIFLRALTGMTNYAAMAKVVQHEDGSMTAMLETAPSGKKVLFIPFPGGQMRFHVLYDPVTKLYWMLGSQTTDGLRRPDRLPAERHDLAFGERHRLVLHFSRNMIDWCFAGLVAEGASPREARDYACMDFDGDDLVILCRSGDAQAKSAHDSDLITFHRVAHFRDLVY